MNALPSFPARFFGFLLSAMMIIAGCAPFPGAAPATTAATQLPAASPQPAASAAPQAAGSTDGAAATPSAEAPLVPIPISGNNVLYEDDFTNPATGWAEAKFDNYFVGYHEPEYYHVEIDSPNYHAPVFMPTKQSFEDATILVQAGVNSGKTAAEGDFAYGIAFRRAGDQYYAFVVSPRSQKWMLLKNSPNALTTLAEGTDTSLHLADEDDLLRVDAKGSTFSLNINGRMVAQVSDPDYPAGEIGFYVQTFDSPQSHVHYNRFAITNYEAPPPPQPQTATLYEDSFTNPATGWAEANFDNYFIGYHEPENYHIQIDSPNYRTPVFMPAKEVFEDATIQAKVSINSTKTAAEGNFAYGIAFRRSGDQYYAFVVSPRSQKWMLLKSAPSGLTTLAEGVDTTLHLGDEDDLLRVDVQGPTFSLHINGRLLEQVSDPDYASGEIGFYVQSFDSPHTHIHYNQFTVSAYEAPLLCSVLVTGLNLREGPASGTPFIVSIQSGESVEPLGHNSDGQWINVRLQGSGQEGWVNSSDKFISCNRDISQLPLIVP